MSGLDREQLAQWVEQQLDGALEQAEFEQLQQVLMDQPEACNLYLELIQQNAYLQLERVHLSTINHQTSEQPNKQHRRSRPINKRFWLSAFAVLAASLLLIVWRNYPSTNSTNIAPGIAQMADSSDAQWGECSLPTAVGSRLGRGHLKIDRGLATIRFASGAEVTLESPAELEIESPLAGKLLAGTAIVEVPNSAHGFTLSTPTAIAIDYGTAFAVTVDTSSKTSAIEVLDGEVEVKHIASDTSLRLVEKQLVVASEKELSESVSSIGEAKLFEAKPSNPKLIRWHRITTADGSGSNMSISRGQSDEVKKNSHSELVLIKNPFEGYEHFARKGYFRFDLASLPRAKITSARLMLTLMPSGLGFASKVDDSVFIVFGLVDESGDDWSEEELAWEAAPANLDGAAQVDTNHALELGRFTVRRGVQHGQFVIEGDGLVRFLNDDTNQRVTLIIVRETQEREPGGLVHGFTSGSSSAGTPPTLIISTDAQ